MDFFLFLKKGIEVTGQSSLSCPLLPSIVFSIPSKIGFLYVPIDNIGIEVQGGHVEGSETVVKLCHSLFSSLIHSLKNCFFFYAFVGNVGFKVQSNHVKGSEVVVKLGQSCKQNKKKKKKTQSEKLMLESKVATCVGVPE